MFTHFGAARLEFENPVGKGFRLGGGCSNAGVAEEVAPKLTDWLVTFLVAGVGGNGLLRGSLGSTLASFGEREGTTGGAGEGEDSIWKENQLNQNACSQPRRLLVWLQICRRGIMKIFAIWSWKKLQTFELRRPWEGRSEVYNSKTRLLNWLLQKSVNSWKHKIKSHENNGQESVIAFQAIPFETSSDNSSISSSLSFSNSLLTKSVNFSFSPRGSIK